MSGRGARARHCTKQLHAGAGARVQGACATASRWSCSPSLRSGCWPPAAGSSPTRSCPGTPRTSSMPSSASSRPPSIRPCAVLESLSLRRASQRRRSAIADLLAAVRAVGAVRCGAVDPRLRSHRLRAPCRRRTGGRRAGLARGLAGGGLDPGGGDLHVRRTGLGPAAAHRHHPELRPFPGRAAASCRWRCSAARCRSRRAFGVVAAMLALGRNHEALLLCFVLAAALAGRDRRGRGQPALPARARARCWRRWAIVAAALVAVPLLLTMQFAALSNRPEVPLDTALEASLYPANLASLAVANVLGSLETHAGLLGAELRHPARGRRHRPVVQLSLRRRGDRPSSCCGSALPADGWRGAGRA